MQSNPSCPSTSRWALLIPSYPPHFVSLARLVFGITQLSRSPSCVELFAILSTSTETQAFRNSHAIAAQQLTIFALDDIMRERHTNHQLTLELVMNTTKTSTLKCWDAHRTMSGLKKLYGMLELHGRGYTHAWVVDSDSMPLREFSFGEYFREFTERPRLLRVNLSSPMIHVPRTSHVWTVFRCVTAGLQLDAATVP